MGRANSRKYTTKEAEIMQPRRGFGGLARPGRGDVDLEKLQDAFMRSTEMPSAKVTRSKVRSSTCF